MEMAIAIKKMPTTFKTRRNQTGRPGKPSQPIPCTKNWTKTLKGKMKAKFPIIRGISIFLSIIMFRIMPNKALQSKTVPS